MQEHAAKTQTLTPQYPNQLTQYLFCSSVCVIDDLIHHEGPSGPCALATKYTPCKCRNLIHTQIAISREGYFPDTYVEGPTDFQTHFTTKRSNRGNNRRIGSLPKTQVKAIFRFGWAKGQYAKAWRQILYIQHPDISTTACSKFDCVCFYLQNVNKPNFHSMAPHKKNPKLSLHR